MLLTREELQERLIALHRASLELIKDVSLETLLERIAAVACEQADARYAAVGVLGDDGALKKFVTVGMTPEEVERMPHPPKGLGLIGALMKSDQPLRVASIADDVRSVGFPANHPPMTSLLGVPIRTAERQLGQIYLTDKISQTEFTADDEKIIQMLAAYAAAAIQNARLVDNLRERDIALTRRSEDLALLNDVASALAASFELDDILSKTLAVVMNYMKVEAGEIFLMEDDRKTLRLVLHRGEASEAFWTRDRFTVGEGIIGMAAESRTSIFSSDLARDHRYLREAVVQAGFKQMVSLPLKSAENVIGVLSVGTRSTEPLDERSVQMLSAVGNWAGLAIENARLHTDARRLAVLEERERIGMDLHDGIIQSIYGVGLSLDNVYHLIDEDPAKAQAGIRHAIDNLNNAIRDLRTYILDLRPRHLDNNESLLDGLRRLVSEYRANTLSEAVLTGPRDGLSDLTYSQAVALFHICQEALANVAKHAHARKVNVSLWSTPDRILLEVRDDGKGFDPERVSMNIGHGLANMATRARNVGGDLDLSSAPDEGTTVLAWVQRGGAY
jgi:signal transduction histidine kinase